MKVAIVTELADAVDNEIAVEKKEYAMNIIRAHKARICEAEVMMEIAESRLTTAKEQLEAMLEDLKHF